MLTPNWRPMTDATRTARVLSDESRSMRPHDGQVAMAIEGNAAVAADGKRPRWLASPSVTHLGTRTQSNDRRPHESRVLCRDRLFDQTAFRALAVLDPKADGTEVVEGIAE